MTEVAVIYIAHAAYGVQSLKNFLDAYLRIDAGIEHDLVVAFKGFDNGDDLRAAEQVVDVTNAQRLYFPDEGYDIGTYRAFALQRHSRFLCFLNSTSEPLCERWLAGLVRHASQPEVGIAGSTASYESNFSNVLHRWQTFPYRGPADRMARTAWYALWAVRMYAHFPSFPNPHVRTNAFVMRRELFLRFVKRSRWSKWTTRYLESGRNSLTRQVRAAGLRTVVVGRDGHAYDVAQWPESRTFRLDRQQNLAVADKQTRGYLAAPPEVRLELTAVAWGVRAPYPATEEMIG